MPPTQGQDLFEMRPAGDVQDGDASTADWGQKVVLAAHQLAVDFTEDKDLPPRFRKGTDSAKARRIDNDSDVERRFKDKVKLWKRLIEAMLGKVNSEQAWRFIGVSPKIDPTARKVTDCKDFLDFVDYLILRRDKDDCNDDELGGLSQLLMAFQREVEKRIQTLQAGGLAESKAG